MQNNSHPEQVGQHSPGKGETILSGGHVAVRGQTLWWQLRRPFWEKKELVFSKNTYTQEKSTNSDWCVFTVTSTWAQSMHDP